MARFIYEIVVETDTQEHAEQVILERIDHDEELTDEAGVKFDYTIAQAADEETDTPTALLRELIDAYVGFYGGDFCDEHETAAEERDMISRACKVANVEAPDCGDR